MSRLSNSEKKRLIEKVAQFIPHSGLQGIRLESLEGEQVGPQITPTLDLRIDHLGVAPVGKDILAIARAHFLVPEAESNA